MVTKNKETVVRIVVEGSESQKTQALAGILKSVGIEEYREAVKHLSPSQLVNLARVCHGRMYKMLMGDWR